MKSGACNRAPQTVPLSTGTESDGVGIETKLSVTFALSALHSKRVPMKVQSPIHYPLEPC